MLHHCSAGISDCTGMSSDRKEGQSAVGNTDWMRGMSALVFFQTFINISVTTGLIPSTGITLPFVSYGLTSLVSFCIGIGLVLNVGLQTRKY